MNKGLPVKGGGARSYSLHNLVTQLQERVPPRTRAIDITDRNWQRLVWQDIFTQIDELRGLSTEFAELMQYVCAIVVNYDSVSTPGLYGGRHTAVMLNADRLTGVPKQRVQGMRGFTGQNHVFFYQDETNSWRRKKARPEGVARAFWLENWLQYMLLDNGPDSRPERDPSVFTLNNMLLRRANFPRPVLITWNKHRDERQPWAPELAPMTLDISELVGSPNGIVPGLDDFVSEFSEMFEQEAGDCFRDRNNRDWRLNRDSISDMLRALLRHFGAIGGDAFFTLPVMLRVNPARGRAAEPDADLRAAVSVLIKMPPSAALMSAGWFFFDGLANRVLTSILASEFMAHSHQRWEVVRADSVHLASHPIKHKSRPALSAQKSLTGRLNQLLEMFPPTESGDVCEVRKLLLEARGLCVRATTNIQVVDGIANLMSLLIELGPDLRDSIEQGLALPDSENSGRIDLFPFLKSAADDVVDKLVGSHSVQLQFTGEPRLPIRRRFASEGLLKHRDLEPILYRAIFSELLQNAANNGIHPTDPSGTVIPVYVDAGWPLRLTNFVDPEGYVDAQARALQISNEEPLERLSSGMYFVKKVFSELMIGKIYASCSPNGSKFPQLSPDLPVWEYIIDLDRR